MIRDVAILTVYKICVHQSRNLEKSFLIKGIVHTKMKISP